MLIAIHAASGRRWLIRDVKHDFHTHLGIIPKAKLKQGVHEINGQEFILFAATFSDELRNIKRRAQIITRKDVGFLIATCGLGKNSIVVESGAGSGGSGCVLANICKRVTSYEIVPEHADVTEENFKKLKLKNASVVRADFYDEKNVKAHKADMVLLDLPEPWQAFASAIKACKVGGFVVAYTPTIVQAAKFASDLPKELSHDRTLELIDRDWKVHGQAIRPTNAAIGHTGFLTIVRRIR